MRVALVMLVASVSVAGAKPLPSGLKIVAKDTGLVAVKNGLTVPLFDSWDPHIDRSFGDAPRFSLSDDGKRIVIETGDCLDEGAIEIPLAAVEARFENLIGMQAHLKAKYADAITHFTTAVQTDPQTPLYATNLLSAQSMAKLLDDADKTLATYGPKNIAWFAWRLAVDPELKNVRARASAKALGAAKPTKITFDIDKDVAVSPLGLVAAGDWYAVGSTPLPGFEVTDLVIHDLAQNRVVLKLPIIGFNDSCEAHPGADTPPELANPCSKAQLARIAEHRRGMNLVLGALGFEKRKTTWVSTRDAGDATSFTSPDKKITLAFHDDGVTVTHGKATATAKGIDIPFAIGWAGNIVVLQHKVSWGCGGMDQQQSRSDVVAIP
jgi:hypothetical protein